MRHCHHWSASRARATPKAEWRAKHVARAANQLRCANFLGGERRSVEVEINVQRPVESALLQKHCGTASFRDTPEVPDGIVGWFTAHIHGRPPRRHRTCVAVGR